jgi:hypothetical protein
VSVDPIEISDFHSGNASGLTIDEKHVCMATHGVLHTGETKAFEAGFD